MDLALSSDQVIALSSAVAAVMAVVTGAVAVFTLLAIKRDSRDRARPLMVGMLLSSVLARGTVELVVENVGPTVAKNVVATFDPPIPDGPGVLSPYVVRRYDHPIPTMAPGHKLSNVYAVLSSDGSGEPDEPVPRSFDLTLNYEDTRGTRYTDTYRLTIETILNATASNPSNTDALGMRKRLLEALEAIARGVGRR